jgi:hypothetical protein
VYGREAARLQNGRYFTLNLPQGHHTFSSTAKGAELELDTKPGEQKYIEMIIVSGTWRGEGRLVPVGEEDAKAAIKKFKPSDHQFVFVGPGLPQNASVRGVEPTAVEVSPAKTESVLPPPSGTVPSSANEPAHGETGAIPSSSVAEAPKGQEAPKPPGKPEAKGCIAVSPVGSHAFRNIMLGGIAGAIVSKKQYKVVGVTDYPAHIGQKFHGNDLQTIQANGVKIVVLDKKYTQGEVQAACPGAPSQKEGAPPK